uniref:Uncharacterized protein n=1 Tax=Arundo donax TaxID=35708 RepID=A0A0A8ZXS0_ARUDO
MMNVSVHEYKPRNCYCGYKEVGNLKTFSLPNLGIVGV